MSGSGPQRWVFVLACCVTASCSRAATEILVVVDSDIAEADLQSLHLKVNGRLARPDVRLQPLGEPPLEGATTLPFSFAVVPRNDDASRVAEITVWGSVAGAEIERTARLGFVDEHTLRLPMFLWSDCVGRECEPVNGERRTCAGGGVCMPVSVSPGEVLEPPLAPGNIHPITDGPDFVADVAIGSDNDIYMLGAFGGRMQGLCDELVSETSIGAYVARIDAETGQCLWSTSITADPGDITPITVEVTSAGVVLVGGAFGKKVGMRGESVDPLGEVLRCGDERLQVMGASDGFIARLDGTSGTCAAVANRGTLNDTRFSVSAREITTALRMKPGTDSGMFVAAEMHPDGSEAVDAALYNVRVRGDGLQISEPFERWTAQDSMSAVFVHDIADFAGPHGTLVVGGILGTVTRSNGEPLSSNLQSMRPLVVRLPPDSGVPAVKVFETLDADPFFGIGGQVLSGIVAGDRTYVAGHIAGRMIAAGDCGELGEAGNSSTFVLELTTATLDCVRAWTIGGTGTEGGGLVLLLRGSTLLVLSSLGGDQDPAPPVIPGMATVGDTSFVIRDKTDLIVTTIDLEMNRVRARALAADDVDPETISPFIRFDNITSGALDRFGNIVVAGWFNGEGPFGPDGATVQSQDLDGFVRVLPR